MKFNITPGPWVIYGQNIYGTDRNGYICTWSGKMANAKAIAAIPNLLKQLNGIKNSLEILEKTPEIYQQETELFHDWIKCTIMDMREALKQAGGIEE